MKEPITEITLRFGANEFLSIQRGLGPLFGEKTPVPAQIKRALKLFLRDARATIANKRRSERGAKASPLEPYLKKRYLTSRGNFLLVRHMDRNHIFNAVRKMERIYRFMKDKDGMPYRDTDSAFPSLPGFAGYADLVAALKWHEKNTQGPTP